MCAQCCPQHPQRIIAKTGRDGIRIHALNCKAIQSISLEKLVKARRKDQDEMVYTFVIEMTIDQEKINLISLLSIVQELGISIDRVKIDKP